MAVRRLLVVVVTVTVAATLGVLAATSAQTARMKARKAQVVTGKPVGGGKGKLVIAKVQNS